MYKAIHVQTGEEIIILNPAWRSRIDQLRAMDHDDLLVCQGCSQPLRVKAGELKRPHFAHKHLKACSYGTESPEILNARAVLYELLLKWFIPPFALEITLEKQFADSVLPRPVDCWVESARGPIAYWIIETGIKLEPRDAIRVGLAQTGANVHYVFLHAMLNEEKKEYHSLLLTPTERAFIQTTPYDEAIAGRGDVGGTLHYLDAEHSRLTTYRGLLLFHRPNWFKGLKKDNTLDGIRVSLRDGELIHPGESDRLGTFQHKRQTLAEKTRRIQERMASIDAPEEPFETGAVTPSPVEIWGKGSGPQEKTAQHQPEALPCAICGQVTTDYWSTFVDAAGRKLCRCRECLDREG